MQRKFSRTARTFIISLLTLMLIAVPAGIVFAESGTESDRGTGVLDAQGSGLAGVAGRGKITVSGNGVLWIKDRAGDAVIHVRGDGTMTSFPGGWTLYTGFNGKAYVAGSAVEVMVVGVRINLHAEGTDRFYLRGRGTYTTSHSRGEWSDSLAVYELK